MTAQSVRTRKSKKKLPLSRKRKTVKKPAGTALKPAAPRKSASAQKPLTLEQAQLKASHILRAALASARSMRSLRQRGPKGAWTADCLVAGAAKVQRLNAEYREKDRPTDVLSFVPPEPVRQHGYLGELVICLPVLKRQARELGHTPEIELHVLVVHGLLHLLELDHEQGEAASREMAEWEGKLLAKVLPKSWAGRAQGLIRRNGH